MTFIPSGVPRATALDLVTKEVAGSVGEAPAKISPQSVTTENGQKQISEIEKHAKLQRRDVRLSQSRGIGI